MRVVLYFCLVDYLLTGNCVQVEVSLDDESFGNLKDCRWPWQNWDYDHAGGAADAWIQDLPYGGAVQGQLTRQEVERAH